MLLWAFSGACVCFIVAALIAKSCREPSIRLCIAQSVFQPGSHHAFSASTPPGTCWAEGTGCNFWALWLSEEIPTSKAAGGSQAIVFTVTTQSVEVRCCWRTCFLTSYCIKCCGEACLHLPLRMPCRWCLHHSGQCASHGWKCGESTCWNEETGQGGL